MHSNGTVHYTTCDFSLQNICYLFFLNRLMRRLGHKGASDLTGICERTLMELEGGDKANIQYSKLLQIADAYGYKPSQVFLDYDTLPSPEEWKELKAKSIELGKMQHRNDWTKPGSIAGKQQDKEWWEWGNVLSWNRLTTKSQLCEKQ